MPQITKVRITNFRYNGNRYIQDELFNLSDEIHHALDTLFSMENGTGKTVMVQLMMQPIIPMAKIAGRNIRSNFNRTSDHCFIMLEIQKDRSPEQLMIGIAIAASQTNTNDTDNGRGNNVRYYTFYTEYKGHSTYDIEHLPVAEKENGILKPAKFEAIRDLARRSNGRLHYYASDDSLKWTEKLEEFGISNSEWKTIEKLNSEEGGLSKFFEAFTTSDKLIDNLLLDAVEKKIDSSSKEDDSLTTMMLNYVKHYKDQKKNINTEKALNGFIEQLKEIDNQNAEIWQKDDERKTTISRLYSLLDALNVSIHKTQAENEDIDTIIKNLNKQIITIHWEKNSEKYYKAFEENQQAEKAEQEAEENRGEKIRLADQAHHRQQAMECAGYYRKILDDDNTIKAYSKAIQDKENGSTGNHEIAKAKYNAARILKEEIPHQEEEKYKLAGKQKELTARESELKNILHDLSATYDKHRKQCDTLSGSLKKQKQYSDDLVQELKIPVVRSLIGEYPSSALEAALAEKQKDQTRIQNEITALTKKKQSIQNEIDMIPGTISDKKIAIHDTQSKINNLQEKIDEYTTLDEEMAAILKEHNLSTDDKFTQGPLNYLDQEREKNKAALRQKERERDLTQETLQAIEKGHLHIPDSMIRYLDELGISYQTGEKYLLSLLANQSIPKEKCLDILQRVPALAYAVIVSDVRELDVRPDWLPAVLPVFTNQEMAEILYGRSYDMHAEAWYARDYFDNASAYKTKCQEKLEGITNQISYLNAYLERLDNEYNTASSFSSYQEDWLEKQNDQIHKLEEMIKKAQSEIEQLELQREQKKAELSETEKNRDRAGKEGEENTRWQQNYTKLQKFLSEEKNYTGQISELEAILQKEEKEKENLNKEISQIQDNLQTCQADLKAVINRIDEMTRAYEDVRQCNETEVIEDTWQNHYDRYLKLCQALKTEISDLKKEMERAQNDKTAQQKEIDKRNLGIEEYQSLSYDEGLEETYCKQAEQAKKDKNKADTDYQTTRETRIRTSAALQNAKEALEEYGGQPIEKERILGNYQSREHECRNQIQKNTAAFKTNESHITSWTNLCSRCEDELSDTRKPSEIDVIRLPDDSEEYYRKLCNELRQLKKTITDGNSSILELVRSLSLYHDFDRARSISQQLSGLYVSETNASDRYSAAAMHLDNTLKTCNLYLEKLRTDLADFNNNFNDLIKQGVLRAKQLHEGLLQITNHSRTEVYPGNKKYMLKIDMPTEVDEMIARESIKNELDKRTQELVNYMSSTDFDPEKLKKMAARTIGGPNLLRSYINQQRITVKAFKIDQNPDNAGYRNWEELRVQNSGAEKAIVYFSVIAAVINYSRSEFESRADKDLTSALLMDNPFGSTSSAHILTPMFKMADLFRIQLICFSDIKQTDVINKFDNVIKAVIKRGKYSSLEVMDHEQELMEHGFYKKEQMSLFD